MRARGTLLQGGLALVALVAAYLTWQRPRDVTRAEVVKVLEASKQSLERVHLEDGTRFIEVARRTDPEPRLWVTTGFLPGKTPVVDAGLGLMTLDAGVDGGPGLLVTVKAPEPAPTRALFANERAETLFARFMPLEASRALGTLEQGKLDELGLVDTPRSLTISVAGQLHRYRVSRPLTGVMGSYLQDERSGQVFLVQSSLFSELDPASQLLVDRRLHAFKQGEFDAFTLSVEGQRLDFVQTGADIPQTAVVARAATPDKPDELARNWHDKIWNRLVVTEVLGRDELPKAGAPKVALRLEYGARGSTKGFLELAFDPTQGTWARSENTPGWVSVHQGTEELVIEARRLLPRP